MLYDSPVLDPWFEATTVSLSLVQDDGTNQTWYSADHYVDALACTDQYQICNPVKGKCTPLTGFNLIKASLYDFPMNSAQLVTVLRLWDNLQYIGTYNSAASRGAAALRASETVFQTDNVGLPDDQWHIEMSNWFAISLAKLQQLTVDYAAGYSDLPDHVSVIPPEYKEQETMCANQIIRSATGTISFSILGVAIILVLGSILIFISLVIDTLVGFLRRKLRWKSHKSLQWILDEKLQLQRMAFEGAGHGAWEGGAAAVPMMRRWGEKIGGGLEQMDPRHPCIGQRDLSYGVQAIGVVTPESEGQTENKKSLSNTHEVRDRDERVGCYGIDVKRDD